MYSFFVCSVKFIAMKTSTNIRWVLLTLVVLLSSSDSEAATCNWKSRLPYFKIWDSCGATSKNKGNIYGYTGFNYSKSSCFKYQWSVNGYNVSSGTTNPRMLQYQPGYNGTYVIRFKVTDTCNNCDTIFTDTVKITCLTNKNTSCNWAARNPKFMLWDSCSSKANPGKISGYIYWNYSIYLQGCFKYYWEVNGTSVNPTASLNRWMVYMPKANGKYHVKLKVVDTCNNCDTTFSDSLTIVCLGNTCNWAARKVYFAHWDTCTSAAQSMNAYIYFGYNKMSCFKYSWTVNGKPATNLNTNPRNFRFKPLGNGVYTICVKVTDTCDGCDTTICYNDTVKCFTAGAEKMKQAATSLTLWPNPTEGSFHVSGILQGDIPFEIYDIRGESKKSGILRINNDEIDISELTAGFYFIRFLNGDLGYRSFPIVLKK